MALTTLELLAFDCARHCAFQVIAPWSALEQEEDTKDIGDQSLSTSPSSSQSASAMLH